MAIDQWLNNGMEWLDIRTLAFAAGVNFFILTVHMVHYRYTRKIYSGFDFWCFGCFSIGAGIVSIILKDMVPEVAAVLLINGFLLFGMVSLLAGFQLFYGKHFRYKLQIFIASAALGGLLFHAYGGYPANSRIILISLLSGYYCLSIFLVMARHAKGLTLRRNLLLECMFLSLCLVFVFRAAFSVLADAPITSLGQWGGIHKVLLVAIIMGGLLIVAELTHLTAERIENENRKAQAEIRTLKGILPICSQCKKIRDGAGEWHLLEAYVERRSSAQFSHSLCPPCMRELYPEFADKVLMKQST